MPANKRSITFIFSLFFGALAVSAAFGQSELLRKNGISIESAVVIGHDVGRENYDYTARYRDCDPEGAFLVWDIDLDNARSELLDGSRLSGRILRKTCGSAKAVNWLTVQQLAAAYNELRTDLDLCTMVEPGKLKLDAAESAQLGQARRRGPDRKIADTRAVYRFNKLLLTRLYPRTLKQGQEILIPLPTDAGESASAEAKAAVETAATAALRAKSFRLLGDDGKAYDLLFTTSGITDRVRWHNLRPVKSLTLTPAQAKLPHGRFVVVGDKKALDSVNIKWYPVKVITEDVKTLDPFKAEYIELGDAKKEFREKAAKGDPLTGLLLQKTGVAKENIGKLTAEQISTALHELLPMLQLHTFVAPSITAPHQEKIKDLLLFFGQEAFGKACRKELSDLNALLLSRSYPRLSVYPKGSLPRTKGPLLSDPEQGLGGTAPYTAADIRIEGAKKDLRQNLKKGSSLTTLILQKAGSTGNTLDTLTADRLAAIFSELAATTAFYHLADGPEKLLDRPQQEYLQECVDPGYVPWCLLSVNKKILEHIYPHAFARQQSDADGRYVLAYQTVCEVPNMKNRLVYEEYVRGDVSLTKPNDRRCVVSMMAPTGKQTGLAAFDGVSLNGCLRGVIEIADKKDRELWIVGEYGGWRNCYFALQCYPDGRLTEQRTMLFKDMYFPASY